MLDLGQAVKNKLARRAKGAPSEAVQAQTNDCLAKMMATASQKLVSAQGAAAPSESLAIIPVSNTKVTQPSKAHHRSVCRSAGLRHGRRRSRRCRSRGVIQLISIHCRQGLASASTLLATPRLLARWSRTLLDLAMLWQSRCKCSHGQRGWHGMTIRWLPSLVPGMQVSKIARPSWE